MSRKEPNPPPDSMSPEPPDFRPTGDPPPRPDFARGWDEPPRGRAVPGYSIACAEHGTFYGTAVCPKCKPGSAPSAEKKLSDVERSIYYGIWINHEDGRGDWMRLHDGMIFYTPSLGHAHAQAECSQHPNVEVRAFDDPKPESSPAPSAP